MNKLTNRSIDLIKQFEGLRLEAYQDSVGVWTIGWGHTLGVKKGMKITEYGAKQMLIEDLGKAVGCVNSVIKKPMNDYEFGAFVSLTHNIGVGGRQANGKFNGFTGSTAARMFNKGDKDGAKAGILMWNKITVHGEKIISLGLMNRRRSEVVYFDTGVTLIHTEEYETTAAEGGEQENLLAKLIMTIIDAIKSLFGMR